MGELCPDNRSSHFDMINDCHFESNNDFPFEMTGFKKYDCRFEMIYDCRFEMTGAKIFVNKILILSKISESTFWYREIPLYSSVRKFDIGS